jgi:hypothetical protein
VFEGTYQGERVAIKTLKNYTAAAREEFLAEASVMTKLTHGNLVTLKGVVLGGGEVMLVTEYMAKVGGHIYHICHIYPLLHLSCQRPCLAGQLAGLPALAGTFSGQDRVVVSVYGRHCRGDGLLGEAERRSSVRSTLSMLSTIIAAASHISYLVITIATGIS